MTVVPRVPAGITGRAAQLLRSEWTKLRSLRSTVWSLAALVVLSVGLTAVATAVYTSQWDTLAAADRALVRADSIGLILQPAVSYGQIALCVLGVLVVGGEYSAGTIRTSLLAVPRRPALLAAKATVFAAVVFVVAELIAASSFLLGQAVLRRHVAISLGDPGVPRALVGFGLYCAAVGLFALAVGAIVRHVAGAIATVLALVLVMPISTSFVPGRAGDYLAAYLPGGTAGQAILSTGAQPDAVVSPWQGLGVMCVWTAVLLGLAGLLLVRRDA
jgi:ABC-2 type transport system permease protein